MLFAFGAKLLGWLGAGDAIAKRFAWAPPLVLAVVVVFIVIKVLTNWFDTSIETAKDAGASEVIIRGQAQTLDQIGDANNAENDLMAGGERSRALYADCLRDNTQRPDTCERYNPDAGK